MRTSAFLALSACLLATAPLAQAITISASIPLPNSTLVEGFDIFDGETWPKTEAFTAPFGTFDFTSQAYQDVTSLESLAITIRFFNLDTNADGGFDRNNITLTLAGYDTGVLLNGFGNSTSTQTVTGILDHAELILTALQTTGALTVGLKDTTLSPSNPFLFTGGTATIYLSEPVGVPLSPSHAAGLLTLVGASYYLRRRNQDGTSVPAAAA